MYAGAKSLVVSLWQVGDRATAVLMTQFYQNMINDGMRPAEALQMAQVSLASDKRWSDPYFWGAFTIVGEWR
jgi:CHAT domain-containing protein